jgi:hypothetical protein
MEAVVTLANFEVAKSPAVSSSEAEVREYDDEDARTVLTGWVGENIYSLNNLVITFTKIEAELGLQSGVACPRTLIHLL